MVQVSYNPVVYNTIPSLGNAGKRFDQINDMSALFDTIRDLFQQHGMERTLGMSLLHRHFEMDSNEMLVEYRGTSVPWDRCSNMSQRARPSNWAVSADASCQPFEFEYSMDDDDCGIDFSADPKFAPFVAQFAGLLSKEGMIGLFGLCRYPGDGFKGRVEITEGRANINLRPDDAPEGMKSREAAWFFSPTLYGKCACICAIRDDAGQTHTGVHRGHVATR